jgi:hypothetical protein
MIRTPPATSISVSFLIIASLIYQLPAIIGKKPTSPGRHLLTRLREQHILIRLLEENA